MIGSYEVECLSAAKNAIESTRQLPFSADLSGLGCEAKVLTVRPLVPGKKYRVIVQEVDG